MKSKYNRALPAVAGVWFDSLMKAVLGKFDLFLGEGNFDFENQMHSRALGLSTEAPGWEVPSENINSFFLGYMNRGLGNVWHPIQSLSHNLPRKQASFCCQW